MRKQSKHDIEWELGEFARQAQQRDGVIDWIVEAFTQVTYDHRPATEFDSGTALNTFLPGHLLLALASTSNGAIVGDVLRAAEQAGIIRALASGRWEVIDVEPVYDGRFRKAVAPLRHS
jgi:hypothetical protein